MSSLNRTHHIRLHDVRGFLRSYVCSLETKPHAWAKRMSSGLKHGYLIFGLEPVSTQADLVSFVRKEDNENLRVTDLAVVVRFQDNKPMVLNICDDTYELRFLATLMEERARKADIEHKNFSIAVARPSSQLSKSKIDEIEQLANRYASGGSRRDFVDDAGVSEEEPASAILTVCGVHLPWAGSNKQPLDPAFVCYLLFSTENKQLDNKRNELKEKFIPERLQQTLDQDAQPDNLAIGQPIQESNVPPVGKDSFDKSGIAGGESGFNVLNSWGEALKIPDFTASTALLKQLTGQVTQKSSKPDESLSAAVQSIVPSVEQTPIADDTFSRGNKDESKKVSSDAHDGVFQHISDAITGLLDTHMNVKKADETVNSASWVAAQIQAKKEEIEQNKVSVRHNWPAARSFENLPAQQQTNTKAALEKTDSRPERKFLKSDAEINRPGDNPDAESSPGVIDQPNAAAQPVQSNAASPPVQSNIGPLPDVLTVDAAKESSAIAESDSIAAASMSKRTDNIDQSSNANAAFAYQPSVISESSVFPTADRVPARLDDFQEPKVVMNEMASLMNKLEAQVARAAKKLTAKAAGMEQRLISNMNALLEAITQEDKDIEAGLVIHGDSVSKEFESLFENLKSAVAENAASARGEIKEKLTEHQNQIEDSDKEHHAALTETFEQIQSRFDELIKERERQLAELVKSSTEDLHSRLTEINDSLSEIAVMLGKDLNAKFVYFKKQLDHEMEIRLGGLAEQTITLSAEMDFSSRHSLEKLKKAKSELETGLKHLINIAEFTLSRQMRRARIEFFLPRLKEREQVVETMIEEMRQTFAERLLNQSQAQLEGLSSSLISARGQLKQLIDECLTKLDLVGRNRQAGLEEIFTQAANSLEGSTENLLQLLKEAEAEIAEGEAVCKKLSETYSLDNDPALTSLRENVYNQVDAWKAQVKGELELAVNNDCAALEEIIRNHHTRLNGKRAELVQRVRFASDNGLQRIRAAIHDAYNAIQGEREKYME